MANRVMYDSTDPRNVPADAAIVAYYPHAWGSDLSHIKAAIEVRIDNNGMTPTDCHALDIEANAATIGGARHWVQEWWAQHPDGMHTGNGWIRKPIMYISHSNVPALKSALSGLDYDLWVAMWDGTETQIDGAFARQYVNHGPHGENYDMSIVYDPTWGIATTSVPPVPPVPPTPPTVTTIHGGVMWPNSGTPDDVNFARVTSTDGGATWHKLS